MAEGLGLAASVAGLVSLGIQVTQGIISYVDALESRREELLAVRQQNDALSSALAVIRSASSQLQGQHQDATAAVSQSLQSCTDNLEGVKMLLAELAHCDTSTWWNRVKNKKKKLSYAFDRSKLQDLAKRLQNANSALELALAGLELDISLLHADKLTTIESSSRDASTQLLLVRSDVAAVETAITKVHKQSHTLNNAVEAVGQLVVTHSEANAAQQHEASASIHYAVQQTQQMQSNSSHRQLQELKEIKAIVKHLQKASNQRQQPGIEFRNWATTSPSTLRRVCDDVGLRRRNNHHAPGQIEPPSSHQKDLTEQSHSLSPDDATEFGCICYRRNTTTTKRGMSQWGNAFLFTETSTKGHWPSCPFAAIANTKHRTASIQYSGLARILKSAISVSFTMTTGAGGLSISPGFTYRPTVDEKSDPAFRILSLLDYSIYLTNTKSASLFNACLTKIRKLVFDNRLCPTAVTRSNQTLMHYATPAIRMMSHDRDFETSILIKLLLSIGVPAVSYDFSGRSALSDLSSVLMSESRIRESESSIHLLANQAEDGQPVGLGTYDRRHGPDTLFIYKRSWKFAKAFGCGPLSLAVSSNNVEEVQHLVTRFPSMLEEISYHLLRPFHLALDKPECLRKLAEASMTLPDQTAHRYLLDDSVLSGALKLSGRQCVNGYAHRKCRRCSCTQSLAILLKSGYGAQITVQAATELGGSSERARRRFISHVSKHRISNLDMVDSRGSGHTERQAERQDWNLVYRYLDSASTAEIFYRHRIEPGPGYPLGNKEAYADYICWLIDHGVDLGLRLPIGPPVDDVSSSVGIFGAHHAYYNLFGPLFKTPRRWPHDGTFYGHFFHAVAKINAIVLPCPYTDGCQCHCSVDGCSPITWMLKSVDPTLHVTLGLFPRIKHFFGVCGREHTKLAFPAAVRYATFQWLGLNHTCCQPRCIFWGKEWVERDDVHAVNEEQADLLDLHEKLVLEFEEKAANIIEETSDDRSILVSFWDSYWLVRMEEELERLNGVELSEGERRAAEEIGVRWCKPPEVIEVEKNPFPADAEAHWFYELDLICPEYKEPWPQDAVEELDTVRKMSGEDFRKWAKFPSVAKSWETVRKMSREEIWKLAWGR